MYYALAADGYVLIKTACSRIYRTANKRIFSVDFYRYVVEHRAHNYAVIGINKLPYTGIFHSRLFIFFACACVPVVVGVLIKCVIAVNRRGKVYAVRTVNFLFRKTKRRLVAFYRDTRPVNLAAVGRIRYGISRFAAVKTIDIYRSKVLFLRTYIHSLSVAKIIRYVKRTCRVVAAEINTERSCRFRRDRSRKFTAVDGRDCL